MRSSRWTGECLATQVKGWVAGRAWRPGAALRLVVGRCSLLLQSHRNSGECGHGHTAATAGGGGTQGGETRGRKTVETGGPGSTRFLSPGLGHMLPKVLPADKWASGSPFLLPLPLSLPSALASGDPQLLHSGQASGLGKSLNILGSYS